MTFFFSIISSITISFTVGYFIYNKYFTDEKPKTQHTNYYNEEEDSLLKDLNKNTNDLHTVMNIPNNISNLNKKLIPKWMYLIY